MNYSITYVGILISVVGTFLVQSGFSEQCSNEVIQNVPVLLGAAIAAYGRWRKGDVTVTGFKQ